MSISEEELIFAENGKVSDEVAVRLANEIRTLRAEVRRLNGGAIRRMSASAILREQIVKVQQRADELAEICRMEGEV